MSNAGKYLTRTMILSAQDLPTEEVLVPEWGGTVLIRAMTGAIDRLKTGNAAR